MRALLFLAFIFVCSQARSEEDSCSIVLDRAAANISYRFGTSTAASTQANSLCDERYDKMSSSEQKGIDAQYEVFKASYSSAGASLKEYRSKYCTSGQSSFFSTTQSNEYSSQIYHASVAAWRDCEEMKSANVLISPVRTPDDRSVVFSITYRGPGNAKVTGVRISPKAAFKCTGENGKPLNGATDVPLNNNSYSIDCTRIVTAGKGPGAFTADASSITITTSATHRALMLFFPAVANPDLATDNATKIRAALNEAEAKIKSLEATTQRLDGVIGRNSDEVKKVKSQIDSDVKSLATSLQPYFFTRLKDNHTAIGQNASCFDVCRSEQNGGFKASCLQTFVPYSIGAQVAYRAEHCFNSYQDSHCLCGLKQ